MNRFNRYTFLLLCISFLSSAIAQTPPSGFTIRSLGSDWIRPVGLTFAKDGRMYVWEKAGRVWIVENDVKASVPFIDISDEVGDWRDHGFLGFALDPDFYTNGFVYLLYAVDRHHLLKAGKPEEYSSTTNEYFNATIGRLTRYKANKADSFRTVDLTSRTVLIGKTPSTGIPITGNSHGVGSLLFGSDHTLLVSCGDGSVADGKDSGSSSKSYYQQALSDSILTPQQNVGAFRAQQLDVLSGKILRIDPATGAGLPSNPFFQSSNPYSPRSRVWALGFRNPFRMTKRPDTGSNNPADGNPGVLYVGDVGWESREEMNIVNKPRLNFGWPLYEGLESAQEYISLNRLNPYFPNPLYNTGNCNQAFFSFSDLLKQATLDPNVSFTNSCDPQQKIPDNIPRFLHSRPVFDWLHSSAVARTGSFFGYNARIDTIGIKSPVSGTAFKGNCSVGGIWYTGTSFPAEYQTGYFHADYGEGWIRFFQMDGFDRPIKVSQFIDEQANTVAMAVHPKTGDLYYVNLQLHKLKKISYSSNRFPVAIATSNKTYGTAPFTVQFSSRGSSDPEGKGLLYEWNFGDGSTVSTDSIPSHGFTEPLVSPTLYTVTLKVTDAQGRSSTAKLNISVNNTPPVVHITSPADNSTYPVTTDTTFALRATTTDNEQGSDGLHYAWQVTLHHNNHQHDEPLDTLQSTSAVISPVGCDGEDYAYIISLTVTDDFGLSGSDQVTLLPNCAPVINAISVYPNPAEKTFTLSVKGYPLVKQVRIQLYNQIGQMVMEQLVSHIPDDESVIYLNSLAQGLYYLQLQLDNEVIVKKLVIR